MDFICEYIAYGFFSAQLIKLILQPSTSSIERRSKSEGTNKLGSLLDQHQFCCFDSKLLRCRTTKVAKVVGICTFNR
jgi:hypothetical protein